MEPYVCDSLLTWVEQHIRTTCSRLKSYPSGTSAMLTRFGLHDIAGTVVKLSWLAVVET
jgi:hypothetical protein